MVFTFSLVDEEASDNGCGGGGERDCKFWLFCMDIERIAWCCEGSDDVAAVVVFVAVVAITVDVADGPIGEDDIVDVPATTKRKRLAWKLEP